MSWVRLQGTRHVSHQPQACGTCTLECLLTELRLRNCLFPKMMMTMICHHLPLPLPRRSCWTKIYSRPLPRRSHLIVCSDLRRWVVFPIISVTILVCRSPPHLRPQGRRMMRPFGLRVTTTNPATLPPGAIRTTVHPRCNIGMSPSPVVAATQVI